MRIKAILAVSALILYMAHALAHGDQVRQPKEYTFVFENQEPLVVYKGDKTALDLVHTAIFNGTKKLSRAVLSFESGEQLVFSYKDSKLAEISIMDGDTTLVVPQEKVEILPAVHFNSVALIWDEHTEKAFNAITFKIQFNVGTKKSFGKYYYVQLGFSDLKFNRAVIWRRVSERKQQYRVLR